MRKALFLEHQKDFGGGQVVLSKIIKSVSTDLEKIFVIAPRGGNLREKLDERFKGRLTFLELPDFYIKDGKKSLIDYMKIIFLNIYAIIFLKYFYSSNFIYINGLRLIFSGAILSTLCLKKFYMHLHIDHSKLEKLFIIFFSYLPNFKKIISNSNFIEMRFLKYKKIYFDNSKILTIENCLDDKFENLPFTKRFKNSDFNIGVFGTLTPDKGQDTVINIAKKFLKLNFFIVGKVGKGREKWFSVLKDSASKNVKFYPFTDDINQFINKKKINIIIVPSKWEEPFGLISIESMAASCISILRNKGGLEEISNNTQALTFKNKKALEQLLSALLTKSPQDLNEISENQFNRTKEKYGSEGFSEKFFKLLID
tara:strand:+ start:2748 stop:3854 length:1107 start_codon:yes stop_codon:yes gene_type:complete